MSHKYIRVYVNDVKIRSTGWRKWQRDEVLKEFGADLVSYKTFKLREMKEIQTTLLENLIKAVTIAYHYKEYPKTNFFKIEMVRKNKSGKKVIGSFVIPFMLSTNIGTENIWKYNFSLSYKGYDFSDISTNKIEFQKYQLDYNRYHEYIGLKNDEDREFCILRLY